MGQRKIRVGELIRRELSEILHSRWRTETVAMTITEVYISPDLRNARVYYSVVGGRENVAKIGRLLASIKRELKQLLSKKVILKYTPELNFVFDPSAERAMRILSVLDELDEADNVSEDYSEESDDEDSTNE